MVLISLYLNICIFLFFICEVDYFPSIALALLCYRPSTSLLLQISFYPNEELAFCTEKIIIHFLVSKTTFETPNISDYKTVFIHAFMMPSHDSNRLLQSA